MMEEEMVFATLRRGKNLWNSQTTSSSVPQWSPVILRLQEINVPFGKEGVVRVAVHSLIVQAATAGIEIPLEDGVRTVDMGHGETQLLQELI